MGQETQKFRQIVSEGEFSYNTSRKHLAQLVEHGLVVRWKRPQQDLGKLWFACILADGVDGQAISSFADLYKDLIVLSR